MNDNSGKNGTILSCRAREGDTAAMEGEEERGIVIKRKRTGGGRGRERTDII